MADQPNTTMLTAARIRELLAYDPVSGIFTWAARRKGCRVGSVAGRIDGNGRRQIKVDQREYPASRLAWLYVNGKWPSALIDHINHIKLDDRIANLREATSAENNANKRGWGKSGFKGVCWNKKQKKWQANIFFKKKLRHLGYFDTPEMAHQAYCAFATKIHGSFVCLGHMSADE